MPSAIWFNIVLIGSRIRMLLRSIQRVCEKQLTKTIDIFQFLDLHISITVLNLLAFVLPVQPFHFARSFLS